MKIIPIKENEEYFSEVLILHKRNVNTLGFLPRGAFESYVQKNQIIIAIDNQKKLIGYLLYSINSSLNLIYIVHLCVEKDNRKNGTAKKLFNFLVDKNKRNYKGIRVRCRRDYAATKVWPKFGFINVHQRPGRSKTGSTLIIWWYDFEKPDLFSETMEEEIDDGVKINAVIDANIFFELQIEGNRSLEDTVTLQTDWLLETSELFVTPEIRNEINRKENLIERKRSYSYLSNYNMVRFKQSKYNEIYIKVSNFWERVPSESNESDLRQISMSIAAGINYFITKDEKVLGKADDILKKFGLIILNPTQFILLQDSISNESLYIPMRLAGSLISFKKVKAEDFSIAVKTFYDRSYEKQSEFSSKLSNSLKNVATNDLYIISDESPIALLCITRETRDSITVPIIRFIKCKITSQLQKQILNLLINISIQEQKELIKITDNLITNALKKPLFKYGFINIGNIWQKKSAPRILSKSDIYKIKNETDLNTDNAYLIQTIKGIDHSISKSDIQSLLAYEKMIYPSKIFDLILPCFIVPIKPEWAMHLFDIKLATHHLFGSTPHLIFDFENIYYRSAIPKILKAPSRILWYVSMSKDVKSDTMAIKATSYCDEIYINGPLQLYNKFKKLGVYCKKDILNLAGNKSKIMAFKFSMTELFEKPINLKYLQKLWKNKLNKSFMPITPIRISSDLYFEIYIKGVNNYGKNSHTVIS